MGQFNFVHYSSWPLNKKWMNGHPLVPAKCYWPESRICWMRRAMGSIYFDLLILVWSKGSLGQVRWSSLLLVLLSTTPRIIFFSVQIKTLIQGRIMGKCVFIPIFLQGLKVVSESLALYLVISTPILWIWEHVVNNLKFQHDKGVVTFLWMCS